MLWARLAAGADLVTLITSRSFLAGKRTGPPSERFTDSWPRLVNSGPARMTMSARVIGSPPSLRAKRLVGYDQWQTTDTTGPTITPEQASARYRVTALGFASSLALRARNVSMSFKYFREFSNRSTFQGNSVQISSTITF